jgi:hypothetical protein
MSVPQKGTVGSNPTVSAISSRTVRTHGQYNAGSKTEGFGAANPTVSAISSRN